MSSSKAVTSSCNVFKRLRISTPQPFPLIPAARAFSTTSRLRRKNAMGQDQELSDQTDDISSLSTKTSLDVYNEHDKLDEHGQETNGNENRGKSTSRQILRNELVRMAKKYNLELPPSLAPSLPSLREPRAVDARLLSPLRRTPTHSITVCNLQFRSFSARNLEFMADFALRAAYFLNLPAKGPIPLPRITERITVPRSHFVNKKSQENFERVTMRRLVQIQDGHPEAVQRWLAFIRKWAWYGVGMKADVWEWEGTGTAARMDANEDAVKKGLENVNWDLVKRQQGKEDEVQITEMLDDSGWSAPLGSSQADTRI